MAATTTIFASAFLLAILAICGIYAVDVVKHSFINKEHRLYHDLFDGVDHNDYHKMFRPVLNEQDPIDVQFHIPHITVEGLDEQKQVLTTNALLEMIWVDNRLIWSNTSEDYKVIDKIRVPVSLLWTPDIILINSVSPKYEYSYEAPAIIYANGTVQWRPTILFQTRCTVDLDDFPYDKHVCPLVFRSSAYNSSLLRFTKLRDGDSVSPPSTHGDDHMQFDVANSDENIGHVSFQDDKYDTMMLHMVMSRRPGHLSRVFVAPSVVLMAISPLIFAIPPECSEKVTLGVGLLIGEILLLSMMEQSLPTAHPASPHIAKYYVAGITLISMSIALAALVRTIWCKSQYKQSSPLFMGAAHLVGRLLCVGVDAYRPPAELPDDRSASRHRLEIVTDDTGSATDADMTNTDDYWRHRERQQRLTCQHGAAEWRYLALVLDRFFLIVSVVLVALVTVSILA